MPQLVWCGSVARSSVIHDLNLPPRRKLKPS